MKLIMLLLIAATFTAGQTMSPLMAAGQHTPTVWLRVAGEDVVDGRSLALAQHELTEILRHAGVAVVWLLCKPGRADWTSTNPCHRARAPSEFWVRIVMRKPPSTSPNVLAFSEIDDILGMRSAAVYYPSIVKAAAEHHILAGVLLGTVIAHEVGHLVLGAKVHAHQGLMSPDWRREQFERLSSSSLVFNDNEARMLREKLSIFNRANGFTPPNQNGSETPQ